MTQATDDVYYLYVGNGWSGPFRVDQIRLFVSDKQISTETYAFEPQQQMQLTVAQLLADPAEADTGSYQNPSVPTASSTQPKTGPLDTQDNRKTVVTTRGNSRDDDSFDLDAVGTNPKAASKRHDDEVIDLDAVRNSIQSGQGSHSQGVRHNSDEDVIDLAPVGTTGRHDDDIIDLDAGTAKPGNLTIEIDEPRGRPAESTLGIARAGSHEALEVVLGELENLRKAYNAMMESSILDRQESQQKVHIAQLAINEVLEERKSDVAELRSLVAEIDQVASELASRHRDSTLSTRIIRLRDSLHESDVTQMVQFAEAVLRRIVEEYDRQLSKERDRDKEAGVADPFATFDATNAKLAPLSATVAERQLVELRKAYDELHQQLSQEQNLARERLLDATALLEREKEGHQLSAVELHTLINEVYRLACDIDPQWMSKELYIRVQELWEGLSADTSTPSAIAPLAHVADEVLLGLVGTLKERAARAPDSSPTEKGTSRRQHLELSTIRAELLQTRTDLTMLKQRELSLEEEKVRLQKLLEEQKLISEKAQQSAKAREQRLRSTVTALEVTKELHQEVMRDLQTQLGSAQAKVEQMELDLTQVRSELTARRHKATSGGDDLQGEMRRVVEMRAMLDARKDELSADIKITEAELKRVNAAPDGAADQALAEMLAAKVNHLRSTYEQTLKRLNDQEAKAQAMQSALEDSRREAGELRGRSDSLNTELESARSNLSSAKKRVDELHAAYARLESERQSLHDELLLTRRITTTVVHHDAPTGEDTIIPPSEAEITVRLTESERRLETVQNDLARERRRAEDLVASQQALQGRITELTSDRDHLKAEYEELTARYARDQERQSAAVASATQTAIEAESRQRQAQARVDELEQRLALAASGAAPTATDPSAALAQALAEKTQLSQQLVEATRERAGALSLLDDAKQALAALQSRSSSAAASAGSTVHSTLITADQELIALRQDHGRTVAQLSATQAEIERLGREIESATNEHHAALSSARNRLAQEQTKSQGLEQELSELREQARVVASQRETITINLAQAISAKDKLAVEVERLTTELSSRGISANAQASRLGSIRLEMLKAQEEAQGLSAKLSQIETSAAADQARSLELERQLSRAQAERQQLLLELDRLRGELVTVAQTRAIHSGQLEEMERLAAESDGHRRQAEQAQTEAQGLRGEVAKAHAELNRLQETVRALAERENSKADALSSAESRLLVESTRWETADKLLADARKQIHSLSDQRDRAQIELAQSEAQRKTLNLQLDRLRVDLERLKTSAQETGPDAVHSLADQARLETLENQLIDARRSLRDLELRETQRLALMTAERDELIAELEASRQQIAKVTQAPAARGQVPESELEKLLAIERAARETTSREARLAKEQLKSVTADFHKLEEVLAELKADPSEVDALHTSQRRLKRARQRIRELERERIQSGLFPSIIPSAATAAPVPVLSSHMVGTATSAPMTSPIDEQDSASIEGLIARLRTTTAGSAPPAVRSALETLARHTSTRFTEVVTGQMAPAPAAMPVQTTRATRPLIETFRYPDGAVWTSRAEVPRPHHSIAREAKKAIRSYKRALSILGLGTAAVVGAAGVAAWSASLPSSLAAVVNARITEVTAPVDGTIEGILGRTGEEVARDDRLIVVRKPTPDTSKLEALRRRLTETDASILSLQRRLTETQDSYAKALKEREETIAKAATEAAARLAEASRLFVQSTEDVKAKQATLAMLEPLKQKGHLDAGDWELLRKSQTDAEKLLEIRHQAETAAQKHVDDIDASRREADPQIDELRVESQSLSGKLDNLKMELQATKGQAEVEEKHVAEPTGVDIHPAATGIIWKRHAVDGQLVHSGDVICEMADPHSIAVDAVLPERSRNDVHTGDSVRLHFNGIRTIALGRIASIDPDDNGHSLKKLTTSAASFRVTISLDGLDGRTVLGQSPQVIDIGSDPGPVDKFLGWLHFKLP